MEHALYALSKKKDTAVRKFDRITVTPSALGRATIWDKDIILFCIAQIAQRINDGGESGRVLRFHARDLLVFCNRDTGGIYYDRLVEALDRLAGTLIRTDVALGGKRVREGFNLIKYKLVERTAGSPRPAMLEIELCEWLFNAVVASEVLTINRDYFRIKGGLERRVYSIVRKHCGKQPKFEIRTSRLHEKSGSTAQLKKFRYEIRRIAEVNALPDYTIEFDEERDVVTFRPRERTITGRQREGDTPKYLAG
jgi:plasmid replication initiation protein